MAAKTNLATQPLNRDEDGHPDAWALISGRLEALIRPMPHMSPSRWAAENLIVPDGERRGEKWSAEETPYIVEPLDMMGPDSPVNELAAMKSAQTGFTMMINAAIAYSIVNDPCRMMVIQPTDAALSDFNRDKLQPMIEASNALSEKIFPQMSRSASGSTIYSKKYAGGSLTMAIASSAADLRSKTIKKLFRDEIDEYPDDLDGQGDPLSLSDGRLMAFLNSGEWKKVDISTPTVKGASKIELRYEQGDKRRWNVPCPHCDGEFSFEFGDNFKFKTEFPYETHYVAPCCGSIIEAHEKRGMVRAGRWVPTDPRPGAFPSYHFDALSSPFVPWDHVAKKFVEAGDNPERLKAFHNLWLGLPYEVRGDAPDHIRLMERREEGLKRGHIPPRGVVLVASADVQMRGIWVEVLAIAQTRETWVVEQLYIDGTTEAPDSEPFEQLRKQVLDRDWPDAFGGTRRIDALGVDSGYRTHVVYSWTRANRRANPDLAGRSMVLALDGREGWGKPAIGTVSLVDIDLDGQKVRKGARIWPVGTYPLKAAFYEDLRKEGIKSGKKEDPEGYCHFPSWLDETYFRQITSEYLDNKMVKGKRKSVWRITAGRENHLLDCRVYNLALADHLNLWSMTEDEWAVLAEDRGPKVLPQAPLPVAEAAGEEGVPAPAATPSPASPPKETIAQRFERLAKANAERF